MSDAVFTPPSLTIVGVAVKDQDGKMLLVGRRKRDKRLAPTVTTFTFIGGGVKAGETVQAGGARELKEEIDVDAKVEDLHHVGSYTVMLEEAGIMANLEILFYDAGKAGTANQIVSREIDESGKPVPIIRADKEIMSEMLARSDAAMEFATVPGPRLLLPNHAVFRDAQKVLANRGINLLLDEPKPVPVAAPVPIRTALRQPAAIRQRSPWGAALATIAAFTMGCIATAGTLKLTAPTPAVAANAPITQVLPTAPVARVSACDQMGLQFDFGPSNDGKATVRVSGADYPIIWTRAEGGGIQATVDSLLGLPPLAQGLVLQSAADANTLLRGPNRPRTVDARTQMLAARAAETRAAFCAG